MEKRIASLWHRFLLYEQHVYMHPKAAIIFDSFTLYLNRFIHSYHSHKEHSTVSNRHNTKTINSTVCRTIHFLNRKKNDWKNANGNKIKMKKVIWWTRADFNDFSNSHKPWKSFERNKDQPNRSLRCIYNELQLQQ